MWGPNSQNGYWGDSRVNMGADILRMWNAEMTRPGDWLPATTTISQSLFEPLVSAGVPEVQSVGSGPALLLPPRKPSVRPISQRGEMTSEVERKPSLTGPYAPRDPEARLLFIGQDVGSIREYSSSVAMGANMCGFATYTAIQESPHGSLYGLTAPVDFGAGVLHAAELLRQFPFAMLSIGLDMVERNGASTLRNIADGLHDAQLDTLADFILASKRAVFLRIGYEFDAKWNQYEPSAYKMAFRKIVAHLRSVRGVTNFVSVWQSANDACGTYKDCSILDWYPGDDVVDWLGGSYLVFDKKSWEGLIAVAERTKKPVMICQAAPQGCDIAQGTYGHPSGAGSHVSRISYSDIWERWFAPFLSYVYENKHAIRAITYINCNWNAQPMWRPGGDHGYYGDTRVNGNSEIRRRWEMEITQTRRWLHANDNLRERVFWSPLAERSTLMSKYSPRDRDRRLLFIGQDVDNICEYVARVSPQALPDGFTTYTSILDPPERSLQGLDATVELESGRLNARVLLNKLPRAIMSIGLNIAGKSATNLKHIVDGTHDHQLDALARFIISACRPVFLSIGYHFDYPHNKFDPDEYIQAYRKTVIYLRVARKVSNFVSVWQSAGCFRNTYQSRPIGHWWPGADVVDWIGTSYYHFDQPSWDMVAELATKYHKPVIISECAPRGFDVTSRTVATNLQVGADTKSVTAEEIWSSWYAPFFAFLNKERHIIRAVSYISRRGNRPSAIENVSYWGDSRVTRNALLKKRWGAEMGRSQNWLQPVDDLRNAIIRPAPSGRAVLAAKFAPRNPNSSLLVLGQELEGILDYATNVSLGASPSGVVAYTAIQPQSGAVLPGMRTSINCGSGIFHAEVLLNAFPRSMLVIGLDIVDRNQTGTLAKIAGGELDYQLDDLAAFIVSTGRPVLLRVGYQFDARWNKYDPKKYRAAFRKIVTHLRGVRGVQNFASVWQSATSEHGTHENRPISDWWPGEDVVDWIGGAYLNFHAPSWKTLIDAAQYHRKPVLICEAAPQRLDIRNGTIHGAQSKQPCSAAVIWNSWFARFFSFVRENSHVIRGITYINCNWISHPLWQPQVSNQYWGDSRLSMNPEIKLRWEAEVTQLPIWLHASSDLFDMLIH